MSEESTELTGAASDLERQTLGERLRVAREYVGLKQDEVAKHLSIPRTALTNIETGQRKVDALELARLAKLYQRPVSWFTGGDAQAESALPDEVAHLARAAAGLSAQDRQELARFAEFLKSRAGRKASGDG